MRSPPRGGSPQSTSGSTLCLPPPRTVSVSLNDFYGTLSDEQKAKFEAIGPIAESEPEPEVEVVQAPVRRVYGPPPIGAIIRQFVRF